MHLTPETSYFPLHRNQKEFLRVIEILRHLDINPFHILSHKYGEWNVNYFLCLS